MSRLVITTELRGRLSEELLGIDRESCAVLMGRSVKVNGRLARIIVRDPVWVPAEAYLKRTRTEAQLRPEFVAQIGQRARRNGESVVWVHTHPFSLNHFSSIDDNGERALSEFLQQRAPGGDHAALLMTPDMMMARRLGSKDYLRVAAIGREIEWFDSETTGTSEESFDRQVRAFGERRQRLLHSLRVGIVGLGGTGSVVVQQLAHLGVRDFLLIDPDQVDATNLNRLIGSTPKDVGRLKVDVARRTVLQISPDAKVEKRAESVLQAPVAGRLADTDFVFCCTDSHGSRAILNQLAYQYLVPMIDMGVVIAAKQGKVAHIAGRTQMLAPGLACLTCGNFLDAEEVRRDLLTDFERRADPYITGSHEPAPAVVSINATIASAAVTMFLNATVGIPGEARLLNYNGLVGSMRPAAASPHPTCVVCSPRGALARGDEWPLPARQG